jgi:hypothetical protein
MSVSEEQCEEMEALASIFGDDFEATGDSSHTVFIAPYQGTGSDDNHGERIDRSVAYHHISF